MKEISVNDVMIENCKLLEENKQLKEDIKKSSENNLNIIDDNVGLKEENKQLKEKYSNTEIYIGTEIGRVLNKQKADFIKELEELKYKAIWIDDRILNLIKSLKEDE